MLKFRLSLGLAVVFLILSLYAYKGYAKALEPDRNEIVSEVNDVKPLVAVVLDNAPDLMYTVPVYEDVVFSEERRKFDVQTIDKIMDKLESVFNMMIEKKWTAQVLLAGGGILPMAVQSFTNLKKLSEQDKSPKMAQGFGASIGRLLFGVVSKSTEERLSDDELKLRVSNMFAAIRLLTEKSPCGLYNDWSKLKVNDEDILSHVAPIMAWTGSNGYGHLNKLFELLATAVSKFGGPDDVNL